MKPNAHLVQRLFVIVLPLLLSVSLARAQSPANDKPVLVNASLDTVFKAATDVLTENNWQIEVSNKKSGSATLKAKKEMEMMVPLGMSATHPVKSLTLTISYVDKNKSRLVISTSSTAGGRVFVAVPFTAFGPAATEEEKLLKAIEARAVSAK